MINTTPQTTKPLQPFQAKDGKLLYFDKEIPVPPAFNQQNAHQQQQVAKQFNQLFGLGFNFALTLVAQQVTQPGVHIPSPE